MQYEKLGLVYAPRGHDPLMRAYAILPTPIILDESTIRVFFASTDDDTVGRLFYLDLDSSDPRRILRHSNGVILDAGETGAFDMHGVNPISMVRDGADMRLYYAGYRRSPETPYTLFTGSAASRTNGEKFERLQTTPILPPTADEPLFRTAAHVAKSPDGWRAWYIGGGQWMEHEGKQLPIYGLRHTVSEDGLSWGLPQTLLDPDVSNGQIGFGRPSVMQDDDGYRMFLSVRTVNGYSVSHARSVDGMAWADWKHNIIPPSADGWDAEMCCYATPLLVNGTEYIFYNGNRFGKTGFGVAVRER